MVSKHWKTQFLLIWSGQAVSLLTSAVLQMALIWHLTFTTQSALVLSLASIAGFLPQAVFGTVAGTLVDRWNRKHVMIASDLFIAAVASVLAIVALFGPLPIWLIFVVLFLRSIGAAFHAPALGAVTPLIVPEDMLTKTAGYSQSIQSVSLIAGPAIAAVLYPIWSMSAMVALDVVGALVAGLTVAMVHIPKLERAVGSGGADAETGAVGAGAGGADAEAGAVGPGAGGADAEVGAGGAVGRFLGEMKAGFEELRRHRGLYQLLWIGAAFMFIFGPINALFPLMSVQHFGGTTTHASIAEVAFAVGMLVGGLVLGVWGGFKRKSNSLISAIALMGLALAVSGLLPPNGFVYFAVACLAMGFSVPLYTGVHMSIFQLQIAPAYLGRVFGLYGSVMSLTMPLGLAVSGVFADQVGVGRWFFISGVLIVAIAGVSLALPAVRSVGEAPAGEEQRGEGAGGD